MRESAPVAADPTVSAAATISVTTSRNRSPFGSGDPFQSHALDPRCPSAPDICFSSSCSLEALVVAFLVVAVAGVAPADQHAIGSFAKGGEHELRIESARAHDANDPRIGRRISCAIRPPGPTPCRCTSCRRMPRSAARRLHWRSRRSVEQRVCQT